MLCGRTGNRILEALEQSPDHQRTSIIRKKTDNLGQLKLVDVTVFRTVVRVLFDSGAVLNIMCADLCSCLLLQPRSASRCMNMADGTETAVVG